MNKYAERLTPYVPLLLRIIVGLIFIFHGIPKVQNMGFFTEFVGSLGFPVPVVFAIIVTFLETMGALLLFIGFGVRWVALLMAIEMTVTTALVKFPQYGFVASDLPAGAGAEFDLLILVAAVALVILGSGQLSMDKNFLHNE